MRAPKRRHNFDQFSVGYHCLLAEGTFALAAYRTAADATPAGKGVDHDRFQDDFGEVDRRRKYRDAVKLFQLSDRELDDIGIRRGDIEFIVRRSIASEATA